MEEYRSPIAPLGKGHLLVRQLIHAERVMLSWTNSMREKLEGQLEDCVCRAIMINLHSQLSDPVNLADLLSRSGHGVRAERTEFEQTGWCLN
jgi:hypothetical protein